MEWRYAAQAGGSGDECWIKPGEVGDVMDMAWTKENSSNETHAVATKSPNAFGLYDMLGNVWEWMDCRDDENVGCRHGGAFDFEANQCLDKGFHNPRNRREKNFGMRLAARLRGIEETSPAPKRRMLTAPNSKSKAPIKKEPQPEPEQCELQF